MACWIRRQILAFGGSLIVGFGGIILLPQLVIRDWSVWLSAVPIPICLLAAVALTSKHWLSGRVSRSLRIQQTAWLLCPLIVFPLIGHSHWKHASDRLIQQVFPGGDRSAMAGVRPFGRTGTESPAGHDITRRHGHRSLRDAAGGFEQPGSAHAG
jgi:hypothetical protein